MTISRITLAGAEHIATHLVEEEARQHLHSGWGEYDPVEYSRWAVDQKVAYMAVNAKGRPVVMGGLQFMRPGVYRTWMCGTGEWSTVVRPVTRFCREVMNTLLAADAHRIECVSGGWCHKAHRWYRLLGLELESEMIGYGADGSTYLMFRRLKDVSR